MWDFERRQAAAHLKRSEAMCEEEEEKKRKEVGIWRFSSLTC
jgi:hypothetical protein